MSVSVLGIDAAWSETNASGVALIENLAGKWICRGVAPTYAEFLRLRYGVPVVWAGNDAPIETPDFAELIKTTSALAISELVLIAVDMPVATVPIIGRRRADQLVSLAFGARGCGTHTPSPTRPGPVGSKLSEALKALGFKLATASAKPSLIEHQLIEVFQHPALLHLLGRRYRVPYKVARRNTYWPDEKPAERLALLFKEWRAIESALRQVIDGVVLEFPSADSRPAALKRYENALDALVAAWIGSEFLAGRTTPYGDETAAIWIPAEVPL